MAGLSLCISLRRVGGVCVGVELFGVSVLGSCDGCNRKNGDSRGLQAHARGVVAAGRKMEVGRNEEMHGRSACQGGPNPGHSNKIDRQEVFYLRAMSTRYFAALSLHTTCSRLSGFNVSFFSVPLFRTPMTDYSRL